MDGPSEAVLQALQAASPGVLANRYLSAAGLTLLLYDNILTLSEEIRVVWRRPVNAVKSLFLFTRYSVLGTVILVCHVTSGLAHHSTAVSIICQGWILVIGITCLFSTAVANFILIVRVYTLYDHRKNILRIMLYTCAALYAVALAFGALFIHKVMKSIVWEPLVLKTCIITVRPRYLIGFWSPQVAFELFTFALTFANAAERPRRAQSKLISELNRDGFLFIFVLFWIRAMNMILSTLPDPSYNLLAAYFSWAVTILTLSRLVLRVEEMRVRANMAASDYIDMLELSLQNEACGQLAAGALAGREVPFITVNTVTTMNVI